MSIKHLYEDERPALLLDFANTKTLDPRITFTRNSTATYVDELGVIKTAAAGEARFDHDPATGESLGLFIEESRTNSFLQSQDLTTTWTTQNITLTANAAISPDGTNNAFKMDSDGTNGNKEIYQAISFTSGTSVTIAWYVKKAEEPQFRFAVQSSIFGGTVTQAYFNLDTGLVTSTVGGVTDADLIPVGNGWYRCWAVVNPTATGSGNVFFTFYDASAPAGEGYYLWGPQAEAGSFPTSYIQTSGSTVQRLADEAEITGTNFSSWYNQSEGTVQVKYSSPTDTSSAYKRLVSISDSSQNTMSANNGFLYGSHSPSTSTRWMARNGASIWYVALASPASLSSAIAYQDDNLAVSYDGATVLTNTSFTVSSLPSRLDFYPNGHISRLAYYNTRLSNTALEALTK